MHIPYIRHFIFCVQQFYFSFCPFFLNSFPIRFYKQTPKDEMHLKWPLPAFLKPPFISPTNYTNRLLISRCWPVDGRKWPVVSRNLKTNDTAQRQNWKLQSKATAQRSVTIHKSVPGCLYVCTQTKTELIAMLAIYSILYISNNNIVLLLQERPTYR